MKLYATIKNGEPQKGLMDSIKGAFREMEGKAVEIEIKPRKRSSAANRYRWGVVNKTVMDFMNQKLRESGLPECSAEDIDLFIKRNALGISHVIKTSYGELVISGRLKNKSVKDFEETMEAIRAYFAPKGIAIPLPRENLTEDDYSHNLERL